jgi:hypothetical protein
MVGACAGRDVLHAPGTARKEERFGCFAEGEKGKCIFSFVLKSER